MPAITECIEILHIDIRNPDNPIPLEETAVRFFSRQLSPDDGGSCL
jgi:hypothetical protein